MTQQTEFKTFCAHCNKRSVEKAATLAGSVRRATIQCSGIIVEPNGNLKLTRCATGFDAGSE